MLATLAQRTLILLLTGVMAGCGFQLRGAAPVSAAIQPLAVVCDGAVPLTLCQAVEEQLRLGDVRVVDRPKADYVLKLSNYSQSRRASAITRNAVAAEYTLRQRVIMSVVTADQVPLVADQEIASSEAYRYDQSNILAKQREQEALTETLNQRLAQQVIFRLAPLTEARIQALRNSVRGADSKPTPGGQP